MVDESDSLGDAHGKWYYCFLHKTVEGVDGCSNRVRMGPYPTKADAENWRERVAARNKQWDEADE